MFVFDINRSIGPLCSTPSNVSLTPHTTAFPAASSGQTRVADTSASVPREEDNTSDITRGTEPTIQPGTSTAFEVIYTVLSYISWVPS